MGGLCVHLKATMLNEVSKGSIRGKISLNRQRSRKRWANNVRGYPLVMYGG
jgi:hypothetical protein